MLARYSLIMAVCGLLAYFFLFPSGIYYSFFFGVMSVTGGIMSRAITDHRGYSNAGIVLGAINVLISIIAFYGLLSIYTGVRDPVMGPKITSMLMEALEAKGISLDTFVQIMN